MYHWNQTCSIVNIFINNALPYFNPFVLKVTLYTPWKHKLWNKHWEKWLKRLEKRLGKKVRNSGNGRRCNGSNRSNLFFFMKKAVPKNFAVLTGKYLCWSLFFNKVPSLGLQLKIRKEAPTHVFSCECCKIFKNTYFEEHLWMAASERNGTFIEVTSNCYIHRT